MNKFTTITATLDEVELLDNLVKKLVTRHFDIDYFTVPKNWRAVEPSSMETYVRGSLCFYDEMNNENAALHLPFTTSMIFTCIKTKADSYELLWSSSLS